MTTKHTSSDEPGVGGDTPQPQDIDHSIDVRYEPDVIKAFNKFIKKWCPEFYSHLIDSDDNDGEFIRRKIERNYILKADVDELEKTRAIIYHLLTTHKTYSPDDYPTDNHFYAAWIANHIHNNFILKARVVEALPEYKRYGSNYTMTTKTTQKYIKEKIGEVTGYNRAIKDFRDSLNLEGGRDGQN